MLSGRLAASVSVPGEPLSLPATFTRHMPTILGESSRPALSFAGHAVTWPLRDVTEAGQAQRPDLRLRRESSMLCSWSLKPPSRRQAGPLQSGSS